ncbi:MAG TPA: hypothetical protein PLD59_11340, partial [Tepidisphaeraceae bacterium]|nr:hypothetical protein [Tepidisphaeraceae bacterium]
MIADLEEVGGFPSIEPITRPADFDTDQDGMADEWERARGLNVGTADHNGDDDGDGYTNLEEYLSELARDETP